MFNILKPLEAADGNRPTIAVGRREMGLVGTGLYSGLIFPPPGNSVLTTYKSIWMTLITTLTIVRFLANLLGTDYSSQLGCHDDVVMSL